MRSLVPAPPLLVGVNRRVVGAAEQAPAPGIVGLGPTMVTSARREFTRGDPGQRWADGPAQIGRALIVSMAFRGSIKTPADPPDGSSMRADRPWRQCGDQFQSRWIADVLENFAGTVTHDFAEPIGTFQCRASPGPNPVLAPSSPASS
jgi:hypothetical protein